MTQEPFRIDVHHHIVPQEYVAAVTALGIKGGGGVDFPHWDPQSSLNMMDRQSIAAAILSLPTLDDYLGDHAFARDLARRYNDYCANLVYRYPQRFGAFATLPLPDVDAALLELEYALDTLHLDGVILMSSYEGRYLGDPAFEPVFTELNRQTNMPVVSIKGIFQISATTVHMVLACLALLMILYHVTMEVLSKGLRLIFIQ